VVELDGLGLERIGQPLLFECEAVDIAPRSSTSG